MENQIFPKEILEYTAVVFRHGHLRKSHKIYTAILIFVFLVLILFPLIKVNLYSSARGQIRSKTKRIKVLSPINGTVAEINFQENQSVRKGDTMFKLDDQLILSQLDKIDFEIQKHQNLIHDLKFLLNRRAFQNIDSLKTETYKSDWKTYQDKLKELNRHYLQQKTHFKRQKSLFQKGVIAKVSYLNDQYELDISKNKLEYVQQQQFNTWQTRLDTYELNLQKLLLKRIQLKRRHRQHYIIAPVDGTILDSYPLFVSDMVSSGQRLAGLSPNSEMIVECYVPSSEIGFLKSGTKVKYQVDAFDHRVWGMIEGKIVDIATDISFADNIPIYKVLCTVNKDQFNSKSQIEIKLQKGMQVTAKFFVARRSLFQLLFDNVHQWVKES